MTKGIVWPEVAAVGLVALQLVVLIVAALFARRQVNEARELREQQNRPFVVIDTDFERAAELFLHVKNLGTSLARDVKIEIEPPLKSAVDIPVAKFKMLSDGISTLAPGKELRTFFDIGFRRHESDLPLVYAATVRYTDEKGKRRFEEKIDLDLEQYMHLHFASRDEIHDVHARLKEIRDIFKRWGWSGGNGLLTISRQEADLKNERRLAEIEEERERKAGG
jgi:hypothetical protein